MELFNKKFVHFMWDDELEGKKCFIADNITSLIECVEKGAVTYMVCWSRNIEMPFQSYDFVRYRFAYYDPNYEVKKAFEDGKTIQYYYDPDEEWIDVEAIPNWNVNTKYRIKPECPCADGIDSKACVGCEQSEDGKPHPFENYHCYGCNKSNKKKYRPYESSAEMIADFTDRFKVKCPPYARPLVWVKNESQSLFLITGFGKKVSVDGVRYSLDELFKYYTYLDGSPCGVLSYV